MNITAIFLNGFLISCNNYEMATRWKLPTGKVIRKNEESMYVWKAV